MRIETNMPTYERLKKCLSERYPHITVDLISSDPILKQLGFVDVIPCVIDVNATEDEIGSVVDDAIQLEIDAFSRDDESSEEWKLYERYGWLYLFFELIF